MFSVFIPSKSPLASPLGLNIPSEWVLTFSPYRCPPPISHHLSFSLPLFRGASASGSLSVRPGGGRAADMRQFSRVNDKRCGNYLSGCFRANQTLTSCERVGVRVQGADVNQLNFNDGRSGRGDHLSFGSEAAETIPNYKPQSFSAQTPRLSLVAPSRRRLISVCAEKFFCSIFNYPLV